MQEVVIVSAVRTAIGAFGGMLKDISAVELGTIVVEEAIKRINLNKDKIDEVIFGNVLQAGQGQNVARLVAVNAGIPVEVPSFTINKLCGSGLKAVALAAQSIMTGENDIVVAGGTENMSQAPFLLTTSRWGQRLGNGQMIDVLLRDGLIDTFDEIHMGITAENIVEKYGITREEQDKLAVESQNRVQKAIEEGKFKDEIVPLKIPQRRGEPIIFDRDEFPRNNTTMESVSKLKPAFKKDGTVTAANSSGINDGAAAVVVMSRERAEKLGLKPLATIKSYASAGVDSKIMGTGPIPAIKKALKNADTNLQDIQLMEINEAFAAQALSVIKELNLNTDIVNVNGGAIALGHPIGASGTRVLITLLYEMEKRNVNKGLVSLCIGGGQGIAMIVEKDK